MWKVAMSEEIGKAVQSVLERVNQAAARRPKVTAVRELSRGGSHAQVSARVKVSARRKHERLSELRKAANI